MKVLASFWKSVKRNPVINSFLIAVGLQLAQDYIAGNIDWAHIAGYLATVCIAVATRMFVVPVEESEDRVLAALAKKRGPIND